MRSSRPLQPEISYLIVDYEPATLARVWIAAAVAGVTMLAFEDVLGRAHAQRWRELVAQED